MSIVTETWRPDAFGFPYDISTDGLVRSQKTGQILQPSSDRKGYQVLNLCLNGKKRQFKVHRLVLEAFVGPKPPGKECSHINGNPRDNRLANLEYDTPQGNIDRQVQHGTRQRGFESSQAKLTEEQVLEIWRLRDQISGVKLAERFGVGKQNICHIHKGRTWGWLTGALLE